MPGAISSPENFLSFIGMDQDPASYFENGSIPLDPSEMQSSEDSQAFIELFPDSPTLNAVKMITSKLRYKWKAMEISDQRNKYFFQTMAEHGAFIQLDKCD